MSSSRIIKADVRLIQTAGPFAPVLTGVSRGLQDLFPPVELPCAVRPVEREDERDAIAPVLRSRPAAGPRLS